MKFSDKKFVFIAKPNKLQMVYRNKNNEEKSYSIVPIETGRDYFTAYCFGRGVKKFKNENVIDIYSE